MLTLTHTHTKKIMEKKKTQAVTHYLWFLPHCSCEQPQMSFFGLCIDLIIGISHTYVSVRLSIVCCVCVCECVRHLLAQRHAAAQRAGEADDFGHKGLEGEVFFEHDPPQDGLHLWDT